MPLPSILVFYLRLTCDYVKVPNLAHQPLPHFCSSEAHFRDEFYYVGHADYQQIEYRPIRTHTSLIRVWHFNILCARTKKTFHSNIQGISYNVTKKLSFNPQENVLMNANFNFYLITYLITFYIGPFGAFFRRQRNFMKE